MKILIVDDESLARERLRRLLVKVRPDAEVVEAGGGAEALTQVEAEQPDLLLLDIRMPEVDGMQVAATLAQQAHPPAIIFCTAYDQHALEALRHQASAYLLKPVRGAELAEALEAASRVNRIQLAELEGTPSTPGGRTRVTSQTHRGLEEVAVAEVRCFYAEQKYVTAFHPEGSLLLPDTLKDLETEFADRLVRVHRNALVALDHIVRLRREESGSWFVELDGVELAPAISRRHLAAVKQRMRSR